MKYKRADGRTVRPSLVVLDDPHTDESARRDPGGRHAPDDVHRRPGEAPLLDRRHFRVLYTRRALGGRLLRRRECRHCGRRVTTYEKSLEKPGRGV